MQYLPAIALTQYSTLRSAENTLPSQTRYHAEPAVWLGRGDLDVQNLLGALETGWHFNQ